MTVTTATHRLLVKTQSALPDAVPLGAADPESEGSSAVQGDAAVQQHRPGRRARHRGGGDWHVLSPPPGFSGQNPWDLCHQLTRGGGTRISPALRRSPSRSPTCSSNGSAATRRKRASRSSRVRPIRRTAIFRPPRTIAGSAIRSTASTTPRWRRSAAPARTRSCASRISTPATIPSIALLPARLRTRPGAQLRRRRQARTTPATPPRLRNNLGHGTGTISILAGRHCRTASRARRRALCRGRAGPRRQSRGAVLQQRDRAGLRLRARAEREPATIGRRHHHEHGRPRLAGLGRGDQRAVRAGRLHRHRGRQQFRQPADAQHRLSGALQPRPRGLRRDGQRHALRRSRPDARWPATTGRTARCAPRWRRTRRTCRGPVRLRRCGALQRHGHVAPRRRRSPRRPRCGSRRTAPRSTPIRSTGCACEAIRAALFDKRRAGSANSRTSRTTASCAPPMRWRRCRRPPQLARRSARIPPHFAFLRILTGLGMAPCRRPDSRCSSSRRCSCRRRRRSRASAARSGRPARVDQPRTARAHLAKRWPRARSQALRAGAGRAATATVAVSLADVAGPSTSAMRATAPQARHRSAAAAADAPSAARLRLRSLARARSRDARHQRGRARRPLGGGPPAGPGRRVPRGDRRRSGQRVLLCAGRPEPSLPAAAPGAGAVGDQSAVPSADGLRGGDEDDRALRARARPRGAVGAAPIDTGRRQDQDAHGIRAAAAHLSARLARRQRLLQPGHARRCCSATSHASDDAAATALPGSVVFTRLSHDIVAHETTHALLDGLHRRFREPTNPDVLAFHEAFADIVALFQHFTVPEALAHQIAPTRGDLAQAEPARAARRPVRRGDRPLRRAARRRSARSMREDGARSRDGCRATPSRNDYHRRPPKPHDRGAVLVAAVFDAFLQIYAARSADLVRLATSGTGVLPAGAIPVDLVERLAQEASKVAAHVLQHLHSRARLLPAGGPHLRRLPARPDHRRFATSCRTIGAATASRSSPHSATAASIRPTSAHCRRRAWCGSRRRCRCGSIAKAVLEQMNLGWDLHTRIAGTAYRPRATNGRKLLALARRRRPDLRRRSCDALGLMRDVGPKTMADVQGELRPDRRALRASGARVGPDGDVAPIWWSRSRRASGRRTGGRFRGGCTLIVDLDQNIVRYLVRKRVDSTTRLTAQLNFTDALRFDSADSLRANYFGARGKATSRSRCCISTEGEWPWQRSRRPRRARAARSSRPERRRPHLRRQERLRHPPRRREGSARRSACTGKASVTAS